MPVATDTLVDITWIAERIGDPRVRIVEIDVSPAAYDEGHIPGAVLWNAYADLRGAEYETIGHADLSALFSRSGLTPETTAVVYGYGAPLGFWLLNAHGHRNVRMLMGSRDQWTRTGHTWSTDVPAPDEHDVLAPVATGDLFATRQDVEAAIGDPAQVLLDVRSGAEYSGERFWPSGATEGTGRAGHIPGAVSLPIDLLRADDGTLTTPDELRGAFEQAGVTKDKTVITYCTIGNRASEAWFGLTHLLGYPSARVYYGSWVEWGRAADTTVER